MKVKDFLDVVKSVRVRKTVSNALYGAYGVTPEDDLTIENMEHLIDGLEYATRLDTLVIMAQTNDNRKVIVDCSKEEDEETEMVACPLWDKEKEHCEGDEEKTSCRGLISLPKSLARKLEVLRDASEKCANCIFHDSNKRECPWKVAGGICSKERNEGYVPKESGKDPEKLIDELIGKRKTKDCSDYLNEGR